MRYPFTIFTRTAQTSFESFVRMRNAGVHYYYYLLA